MVGYYRIQLHYKARGTKYVKREKRKWQSIHKDDIEFTSDPELALDRCLDYLQRLNPVFNIMGGLVRVDFFYPDSQIPFVAYEKNNYVPKEVSLTSHMNKLFIMMEEDQHERPHD